MRYEDDLRTEEDDIVDEGLTEDEPEGEDIGEI